MEKNGTEMFGIEVGCTAFVGIEVVGIGFAGIEVVGTEVAGIELEVAIRVVRVDGIGSWLRGGVHDPCCCILDLRIC